MAKFLNSIRTVRLLVLLLIALAGILPAHAQNPWQQLPATPALPKPETTGTVPANGVRLWYATYGHGAPVILLHGGLGNSDYFGFQVPALARHYEVIVMDSRGHGRSTWDGKPIGYHQMAEDVIGLMDALHLPKAAIVGWSDGAIIGLDMAIHHPNRLTRLFAFGANSTTAGIVDPTNSVTFATYRTRTLAEYQKLSPAPKQFDAFAKVMEKMWNTEPDFSDAQLRGIRVPTWIVDGDHEEFIKRADTDRMARLIPNAGELILPWVSHFAVLQNPGEFNQAVLEFLAGDEVKR
jgi:pimeloyl-ACP methyl ester carboxylesterase